MKTTPLERAPLHLNSQNSYSAKTIELPDGYKLEEAGESATNNSVNIIDSNGKNHEAKLFVNPSGEVMVSQPDGKAILLETHIINLCKDQVISKNFDLLGLTSEIQRIESLSKGGITDELVKNTVESQINAQEICDQRFGEDKINIAISYSENFLRQKNDLSGWLNQFFSEHKIQKIEDKATLSILFEQHKKSAELLGHAT